MDTRGRHLLVEYMGCSISTLDDVSQIQTLLERAAHAANTRIVASLFRPFQPQGVTGVVVIEESHLSIHTWPEHRYASVDFYTCGEGDPEIAHKVVSEGLEATSWEIMQIERGLRSPDLMKIQSHTKHPVFHVMTGT